MKSPHPERLLALLREQEPSLIQAGFDEHGEPYVDVVPGELSDVQRTALASLMMKTASGLLGGSLGAVLHGGLHAGDGKEHVADVKWGGGIGPPPLFFAGPGSRARPARHSTSPTHNVVKLHVQFGPAHRAMRRGVERVTQLMRPAQGMYQQTPTSSVRSSQTCPSPPHCASASGSLGSQNNTQHPVKFGSHSTAASGLTHTRPASHALSNSQGSCR